MAYPATFNGWTEADMEGKFRLVTGTPSTDQLTSQQILGYFNQVYEFVMPFELKEQIENQFLNFKTTPGIDIYAFPSGYFTDQPGAYADGFPMVFYQDPDMFYQDWPEQYAVDNLATGDGVQTVFTGGLQNPPIIEGTAFIASVDSNDLTVVASDQGVIPPNVFPNGTMSGPGVSGAINYLTGAFSVTYTTAPSSTAQIYAKYQGYQGNRPQGVLFFNNQFTLRPVPDQVYQIKMQGYIQPVGLTLFNPSIPGSGSPALQPEWGAYIVYAAALELFSDRGDLENYERYFPIFKRYENIALGRTIQQLTNEQAVGRF